MRMFVYFGGLRDFPFTSFLFGCLFFSFSFLSILTECYYDYYIYKRRYKRNLIPKKIIFLFTSLIERMRDFFLGAIKRGLFYVHSAETVFCFDFLKLLVFAVTEVSSLFAWKLSLFGKCFCINFLLDEIGGTLRAWFEECKEIECLHVLIAGHEKFCHIL